MAVTHAETKLPEGSQNQQVSLDVFAAMTDQRINTQVTPNTNPTFPVWGELSGRAIRGYTF